MGLMGAAAVRDSAESGTMCGRVASGEQNSALHPRLGMLSYPSTRYHGTVVAEGARPLALVFWRIRYRAMPEWPASLRLSSANGESTPGRDDGPL